MRFLFFIVNLFYISCYGNKGFTNIYPPDTFNTRFNTNKPLEYDSTMLTGAQQTHLYINKLKGKRVALVVNQTSLIGKTHLVDSLLKLGINIKTIFAPEHGFRGDHSAGEKVNSSVDAKTGIAITSLYGKNKKPSNAQLQGIDIVVFDIQDVGVRFYTYISTMHYVMEACAENGISFILLDRPNPNGYYIDGPVLDLKFKSFIGMHPIPLVHGMTVGELALMINGEKWLDNNLICSLEIVKVQGYAHHKLYRLPVRPSPNLPTMESIFLYPSLGLFEGTNVSVGRGTPKPFEWIGRPGSVKGLTKYTPVKIPGVADNPPYENKECIGILLTEFCNHYLRDSKKIYLEWLILFYESNKPENGEFFIKSSFDRLAGTDLLRNQIIEGKKSEEIQASWKNDLEKFKVLRQKYLIYED